MSGAVTAVAFGAAVAAAAVQTHQAKKAGQRQAEAAERQAKQAEAAAKQAAQDQNRANRRQADISGLLSDNTAAGDMGGTSLTGAAGAPVDNSLLGGGNTLLGG